MPANTTADGGSPGEPDAALLSEVKAFASQLGLGGSGAAFEYDDFAPDRATARLSAQEESGGKQKKKKKGADVEEQEEDEDDEEEEEQRQKGKKHGGKQASAAAAAADGAPAAAVIDPVAERGWQDSVGARPGECGILCVCAYCGCVIFAGAATSAPSSNKKQ
jgi:hypothetical protein